MTAGARSHDPSGPIDRAAAVTRRIVDLLLHIDPETVHATGAAADLQVAESLLSNVADRLRPWADDAETAFERELTMPFEQVTHALTSTANGAAPPLDFVISDDLSVRADFVLGRAYQGPVGLAHGGVSAMVLDHALGVATEAANRRGFTVSLELRYRRPVPLLKPLHVRSRCSQTDGRKSFATGEILHEDEVCVEAVGVFVTRRRPIT